VIFDEFFKRAIPQFATVQTRDEGPAFLNVARKLYEFAHIDYLALNVPGKTWRRAYMHSRHCDQSLSQCVTDAAAAHEVVTALSWAALSTGSFLPLNEWNPELAAPLAADNEDGVVFALRALHNEIALAAVTWHRGSGNRTQRETPVRDLRLLMNYFHSQILRINGVDADEEILMSARELDCLSWTAAGKTAWEASIILGISERTVRFHLNVAREKLKCATTTQAVAKAISKNLIELSA
jgi:DNA-binding CsgD family transcriptional regulator